MTAKEENGDWIVGIDVGGTFTDIIALDRRSGEVRDGKALSTREQENGVLDAIASVDLRVTDIVEIVHGHTVGINALLSRTGVTTGLLATRGHRDLLDIGRMHREFGDRFYDPTWIRPHQERPIVERELRRGVPERLKYDGTVLLDLDESAVRESAREFAAAGVSSVGVCMLNSYVNPAHELRTAEILGEELPGAYVQTSALYPVTREHERTATVALDAYVGPIVVGYLNRLMSRLGEEEFTGTVWIMMMNGGVATFADASRAPVFQLVSGPVGGVSGSVKLARESGHLDLLTMDVGGTSTDVAAIRGGKTPLTDTWTLETGLTLTMPLVDVESIGSGAGSLIQANSLGNIAVGPSSAGSDPGPVSYGRGGTAPTLTDACLALGILQSDLFANGTLPLDHDLALGSLEKKGREWSKTEIELASSAYELACQDIAAKIRSISVHRGWDLDSFALQPSGSAGPMLANRVAEILGVSTVLIPPNPGQFSALGLLRSDLTITRAQSIMIPLADNGAEAIEAAFAALQSRITEDLSQQGIDITAMRFDRALFAMYAGQTWDNRLPIGDKAIRAEDIPGLVDRFNSFYRESYGFAAAENPVVVSTVEVTAVIPRGHEKSTVEPYAGPSLLRRADLIVPGTTTPVEAPIHMREKLDTSERIPGPAVIAEKFATTLVLPGHVAHLDDDGNLVIDRNDQGDSK